MDNQSEILFYTADDGKTSFQVRLEAETVWLTQKQVSEFFKKSRVTITEHINHVFEEGELMENSVCRNFRHTDNDGKWCRKDIQKMISGKCSSITSLLGISVKS